MLSLTYIAGGVCFLAAGPTNQGILMVIGISLWCAATGVKILNARLGIEDQ
jgi:hypothetical protein